MGTGGGRGVAETCVVAECGQAAKSPLDGFWWPLMQQPHSKAGKKNKHKMDERTWEGA